MSRHTNPLLGWPHDDSPFHRGERSVQSRVGVRAKLEEVADRLFRGAMPDQHRELFEKLPFLVVGSLDADRRVWASVLGGEPGFVHTPDASTLAIAAGLAAEDPLGEALRAGAPVGLLGIELATRRRNRVNGVVAAVDGAGLVVRVQQSFGNCPKYIHVRDVVPVHRQAGPGVELGPRLSPPAARLVAKADTCFIATASAAAGSPDAAPSEGVDVSHRGGPPGFVQVGEERERTVLTIPDYVGNFFFNTLGNLEVNSHAGLLFLDFQTGDILQLTGRVEVAWDGPEVEAIAHAQRLLRFLVDEGRWRPAAFPFRGEQGEPGPRTVPR
jgi:uncharacterized protein